MTVGAKVVSGNGVQEVLQRLFVARLLALAQCRGHGVCGCFGLSSGAEGSLRRDGPLCDGRRFGGQASRSTRLAVPPGPGFRGVDRGRGCVEGGTPTQFIKSTAPAGNPAARNRGRVLRDRFFMLSCTIFRERQPQKSCPWRARARARLVPRCSRRIPTQLQSLILGEANNCNAILPFSSNLQQPGPARLAQAMLWGTEAKTWVEEECPRVRVRRNFVKNTSRLLCTRNPKTF